MTLIFKLDHLASSMRRKVSAQNSPGGGWGHERPWRPFPDSWRRNEVALSPSRSGPTTTAIERRTNEQRKTQFVFISLILCSSHFPPPPTNRASGGATPHLQGAGAVHPFQRSFDLLKDLKKNILHSKIFHFYSYDSLNMSHSSWHRPITRRARLKCAQMASD